VIAIDWASLGPYVVAILGIGGTWLTAKIQHRGKPENALIDQLQEQQATSDRRIDGLQARIEGFEARDALYIPHIIRLNAHIEQGLGPPAPPIPRIIQQYLRQQLEDGDA
jgi:hypothetical protein